VAIRKKIRIDTDDVTIKTVDPFATIGPAQGRRDAPAYDLADTPPPFPEPFSAPASVPEVLWASSVASNPLESTIRNAGATESLIRIPAGEHEESIKISSSLHFVGDGKAVVLSDSHKDCVHISGGASTFEGITFIQRESDTYSAVLILGGTAVFRNCEIVSNIQPAVVLRDGGRAVFINCKISSERQQALEVKGTAAVSAQHCTFRSAESCAISAVGQTLVHFDGCTIADPKPGVAAVQFAVQAEYLFENSRICQPFLLNSSGVFTVIRNCEVDTLNLRVPESARCLLHTCSFSGVALEAARDSGVRAVNSRFVGGKTPALRVVGATVELNECEFSGIESTTAVFVTGRSVVGVSDSLFHDTAGSALFALGAEVGLRVSGCGFGNVGASAIVVNGGADVNVDGSLFERVRGAGLLFVGPRKALVRGSQFARCKNTGVEIRYTPGEEGSGDCAFDSCVFQENGDAGLYASGGRLAVTRCDFLGNGLAGLDVRGSSATVSDVLADGNGGGGFAFSDGARVTVAGLAATGPQAFGIAVKDASDVCLSDVAVAEGSSPGVYAAGRSVLKLTNAAVEGVAGVGVLVCGEGTVATLVNVTVSGAGAGVQVLDHARVDLGGGKFLKNGVHVDVAAAALEVADAVFAESRNGIGVLVRPGSEGTFRKCSFARETKGGIAIGGKGVVSDATIEGCQLAGVYWYGGASGVIEKSVIQNNEQCGVVIMGGGVKLVGNNIDGHTIYGVHVNPGLHCAVEVTDDNVFGQNTMADVNYEDQQ
jgi:hypothetical protein